MKAEIAYPKFPHRGMIRPYIARSRGLTNSITHIGRLRVSMKALVVTSVDCHVEDSGDFPQSTEEPEGDEHIDLGAVQQSIPEKSIEDQHLQRRPSEHLQA